MLQSTAALTQCEPTVTLLRARTQRGRPTFHSHIDALVCGKLRLHQHVAGVFPLVHVLLHIKQLERAVVLKGSLAMVVRQQIGVLVPLYGVVRVANDTAVNIHVSPSDGSEVLHRSDAGRPL